MRTTVNVPDELLRRAKCLAAERGVTLAEVVVEALRQSLERQAAPVVHEPFELVTFRGTSDWPDLDFDRASDLLAAEDEERYRVAEPPAAYRTAATGRNQRGEPE